MVSEFSPAGIIGAGIPTSTILLEVILGDPPPPKDFVEVLPGLKLKWTSVHARKELGAFIKDRERPLVCFTLEWIQHKAVHRFLDVSKIHVGRVELKRLRITPTDVTSDQIGHLNLSDSGDS